MSRTAPTVFLWAVMLLGLCLATAGQGAEDQGRGNPGADKYALVYNGPVSAEDCPESAAAIAQEAGIKVKYVSDVAELPRWLQDAEVFIIGGTGDDLLPLVQAFTPTVTQALKDYLNNGGRYLGICGGGFMASTGWDEDGKHIQALGIIPAGTSVYKDDYVPRVLPITWLGKTRPMYFKAGPYFQMAKSPEPVEIIANYGDGSVAAFMSAYGKGKIAVIGPHPEARESWKDEAADGHNWVSTKDLAVDLLRDLLSGRKLKR